MKAVSCSDRDLALPGGVLLAVWKLLCSYKPRARACTSVTLKSKDAYRRFGHKCQTLWRTLPLTSVCLRIWWHSASIRAGEVRDVFSTAS